MQLNSCCETLFHTKSNHESHLGILSVSDASPWDQHIFGECADPRLRTHLKCAFKSVTGRGGGGGGGGGVRLIL